MKMGMKESDKDKIIEERNKLKESIANHLDNILAGDEMSYGLVPLAEEIAKAARNPKTRKLLVKADYRGAIKQLTDYRFGKETEHKHSGSIDTQGFSAEEIAALRKDADVQEEGEND